MESLGGCDDFREFAERPIRVDQVGTRRRATQVAGHDFPVAQLIGGIVLWAGASPDHDLEVGEDERLGHVFAGPVDYEDCVGGL
jgi:hypothetical protein